MAESVVLVTEKREGRGSRQAEKLRKQGKVPAVVYGHKEATVSVSVPHDTVLSAVRHGARVVDITVGGKTEKAQIVEVQWDYLGKDVLHVDFKRVSADERIEVEVPVELRGIAPGASGGAGVLDQPLHTIRLECPALAVPETIRVSIAELQVGSAIHVRELKLPDNVKALEDPDAIVVHVTQVKAEAEAGEAAATTAEPEVITRKKGEEEGEEK
ncbi:MAG: 50S ribosomal protein L25 [Gemmataceae bacterium]